MKKISMPPKKSTSIDMTALCDFTLLLLTFFIMSSKFKPVERVEVRTPSSTSSKEIGAGFMQITLDEKGRVFFAVDNIKLKRGLIEEVNRTKGIGLTESEMNNFINGPSVGVPFTQLKSYLAMDNAKQAEYDKIASGIPADSSKGFESNELAYWIQTTRFQAAIIEDLATPRIMIKADAAATYPDVDKVIKTLAKIKIFQFTFNTGSKAIPPGSALAENQGKPATTEETANTEE